MGPHPHSRLPATWHLAAASPSLGQAFGNGKEHCGSHNRLWSPFRPLVLAPCRPPERKALLLPPGLQGVWEMSEVPGARASAGQVPLPGCEPLQGVSSFHGVLPPPAPTPNPALDAVSRDPCITALGEGPASGLFSRASQRPRSGSLQVRKLWFLERERNILP